MRLSEIELRILRAIEFKADVPVAEIAKLSRVKTHSVTYYVSKLRETGILGSRRPSINRYALGLNDFQFLFSLAIGSSAKRQKFISMLKKSEDVVWAAEVGGAFQMAITVQAKQVQSVLAFMRRLRDTFPNLIRHQEFSIVSCITSYGRRFLYEEGGKFESFKIKLEGGILDSLDSVDYSILAGLSELNYSSERDLGRYLALPPSTLRRRVDALERKKVINGYYYHVDTTRLGYQTYKLLIFSRGEDSSFSRGLERFSERQKNVVHCLESLGSWQNELVVEVKEAEQASQLASQLQEEFESQIESVHVIPLFKYLKAVPFLSNRGKATAV